MKEHGLLLSAPMVRALAEGRKTQTRRAIAAHNSEVKIGHSRLWRRVSATTWNALDLDFAKAEIRTAKSGFPYLSFPYREDHAGALVRPRIKVGDGLWWKETWAETESDAGPVIAYRAGGSRIHCASGESRLGTLVNYLGPDPDSETYEVDRWKSSMFMPRWAARYSNTVTRVLAERIQSISEADSIAEGIIGLGDNFQGHNPFSFGLFGWPEADWKTSARDAYFELWRRINCEDSLEANPLVWGYDWQFPQGRDMTRCHVMQAE